MGIDFRHSLDRSLAALPRLQRTVRHALALGTRELTGRDDSGGALHRAAAGATLLSQTVYALTYLKAPRDDEPLSDERERAELYVRLGQRTFAVSLVQRAAEDWQASRILEVDALPAV